MKATPIVLTAATGQEVKAISKCLVRGRKTTYPDFSTRENDYRGNRIITVQTGIKKNGVEQMLTSILMKTQPSAVISLGLGGALTAELKAGDMIICTGVVSTENTDNRYQADKHLLKQAGKAVNRTGIKSAKALSATVSHLVMNEAEKRGINKTTGALVCEMEDYWIARAAQRSKVPFLSVRVIFDTLEAKIPDYNMLVNSRGNISVGGVTKFFVANPQLLFTGWSALGNSSGVMNNLSVFTERFLDQLVRAEVKQ